MWYVLSIIAIINVWLKVLESVQILKINSEVD